MKIKSSAVVLSVLFGSVTHATPIVLGDASRCTLGASSDGVSVSDVSGNLGNALDCWGAFKGNDAGPSGDGYLVDDLLYEFVAKYEMDGAWEGSDIGLTVSADGVALSGAWFVDPQLFSSGSFLVVLKAASNPGFAVWLFDSADAGSWMGSWTVAWGHELSHFSLYAAAGAPDPLEPKALPEPGVLALVAGVLPIWGWLVFRRRRLVAVRAGEQDARRG